MIGCNWKQEKRCSAFLCAISSGFFLTKLKKTFEKLKKTFFFQLNCLGFPSYFWCANDDDDHFDFFDCFQSTTVMVNDDDDDDQDSNRDGQFYSSLFIIFLLNNICSKNHNHNKHSSFIQIESNRIKLKKNRTDRADVKHQIQKYTHRQTIFKSSIIDIITFQQ